jgi:predicted MFS family arabinose efflux permease
MRCEAIHDHAGFVETARRREPAGFVLYSSQMNSRVWFAIFIGSTIGGFVPALWGGELLSYAGVLFSGVGAVVGLWLADRTR